MKTLMLIFSSLLVLVCGVEFSGNVSISGSVSVSSMAAPEDPIAVDSFQDFRDGEEGQVITDAQLGSSKIGDGTWFNWNGIDEPYALMTVAEGQNYTLPNPLLVDGQTITETGTKWLRTTHTGNNTHEYSYFLFDDPGTTNGLLIIRLFIRFNASNAGETENLDLITTDEQWGVLQQTTAGGTRGIQAHSGAAPGAGNNVAIDTDDSVYYIVMIRDNAEDLLTIRIYDPLTFELVGTATHGLVPGGNAFRVRFSGNYLNNNTPPIISGHTDFGGISFQWTSRDERP